MPTSRMSVTLIIDKKGTHAGKVKFCLEFKNRIRTLTEFYADQQNINIRYRRDKMTSAYENKILLRIHNMRDQSSVISSCISITLINYKRNPSSKSKILIRIQKYQQIAVRVQYNQQNINTGSRNQERALDIGFKRRILLERVEIGQISASTFEF